MPETSREQTNIETARRYLAAVEGGATGDALAAFYTPDAVQEELPNRFMPNGARRDLAAIRDAADRGRKAMVKQRYDVRSVLADGDRVVLEVLWVGTLAVPFGSTPAGGEMRAHFAVFLDFRNGRIAAQRNYDCFEPF
jgi:ketosteroid isomerase-like protein